MPNTGRLYAASAGDADAFMRDRYTRMYSAELERAGPAAAAVAALAPRAAVRPCYPPAASMPFEDDNARPARGVTYSQVDDDYDVLARGLHHRRPSPMYRHFDADRVAPPRQWSRPSIERLPARGRMWPMTAFDPVPPMSESPPAREVPAAVEGFRDTTYRRLLRDPSGIERRTLPPDVRGLGMSTPELPRLSHLLKRPPSSDDCGEELPPKRSRLYASADRPSEDLLERPGSRRSIGYVKYTTPADVTVPIRRRFSPDCEYVADRFPHAFQSAYSSDVIPMPVRGRASHASEHHVVSPHKPQRYADIDCDRSRHIESKEEAFAGVRSDVGDHERREQERGALMENNSEAIRPRPYEAVVEHQVVSPPSRYVTPMSRREYGGHDSERSSADAAIEAAADLVEERSPSKRESITKLLLKSKEFLKTKSLVRNRNNEIDWVATFLNVGFESNSIYSLMCPLRKGRWKVEEEKYTMELLRLIENGTIRLRHGQSIRGFIAKKLHSDDMRVLKKLSNCKAFHFARLITPRMSDEEAIDHSVPDAQANLEKLEKSKGEFLRSVQLEALVAVRKYLSDSSIRELLKGRD